MVAALTPVFASGGGAVEFPLLTALVLTPIAGALAVALLPGRRSELSRLVALLFSGSTGAFSLWLLGAFDREVGGYQFETARSLVSDFGISWHLGVDGISLFLVVLTGVLFPLTFVAVTPHHDPKPYYAWLLLLQAGCLGAFLSLDLFLFFAFFEIVLVPMYFLIGRWGYSNRVYAALKFFLYTMFGSALMLVGILSLAFIQRDDATDDLAVERAGLLDDAAQIEQAVTQLDQIQQQAIFQGGTADPALLAEAESLAADYEAIQTQLSELPAEAELTFDLPTIAEGRADRLAQDKADGLTLEDSWNPLDWEAAKWIFLAFALAFAVKVPLFPVHTWLPDAHTQAPTAGSVILAGVMLKLGTYGFLRFGLYLLPDAATFFAPVFVALGVVGIIYGAVVATMQKDLKAVVAYSSIAHLGFIALGTFAITTQALEGSILQMVNHGISTGALFLLVGMIYDRRHTRVIAELSGLQKAAPVLAAVFALVMFSSIGVPGLNGFVGEFLILTGSYLTQQWWAVVAAAGVILAAVYLVWAYQRVFHGTPTAEDLATPDLRVGEFVVLAPLLGLIVFMGLYPKPFLERIEPSVTALVEHVEATTDFEEPDAATSGFSGEIVDHHGDDADHDGDDDADHGEGE